jgi:ribosomal protein S18 acetylase RimI-like enzyme
MPIKPKIRMATQADAQAILDLNRRAWPGYTTHELLEHRHGMLNGLPWAEHIANAVASHIRSKNVTTFVAEHQGRVIGYAAAQIKREGPSDIGTVGYNAVDPDYRQQGVGTALIQQAMKFLKEQGARVLTVVTLETDEPVRRIYERLGFKELTRLVYYSKEC